MLLGCWNTSIFIYNILDSSWPSASKNSICVGACSPNFVSIYHENNNHCTNWLIESLLCKEIVIKSWIDTLMTSWIGKMKNSVKNFYTTSGQTATLTYQQILVLLKGLWYQNLNLPKKEVNFTDFNGVFGCLTTLFR